jgi:hypothetical protein
MGKRAATKVAPKVEAAPKKAKATVEVDPAFTSISDAVMEAELPDRVRAMLVEMMPFSLKFASDERHELQSMAVDMMEQTLTAKKDALTAAAVAADESLKGLKASESQLGTNVTDSEAALGAQKDVVEAKKNALADATAAEKASKTDLAEKKSEQKTGEKKFVEMQKDKEAIGAAFAEHFPPMKEGESKAQYKKLEPFLKKLNVESTLLTALPSCCGKSLDKRGTFDNLVLEELDKAFKAQIEALGEAVIAEGPAAEAREQAVQAAEKDHEAKKAALETATSENKAALTELHDGEKALKDAKKAVVDFQPKLEEMTGQLAKAQGLSAEFDAGRYANFLTYKARVVAVPEEAPAAEAPAAEAAADAEVAA